MRRVSLRRRSLASAIDGLPLTVGLLAGLARTWARSPRGERSWSDALRRGSERLGRPGVKRALRLLEAVTETRGARHPGPGARRAGVRYVCADTGRPPSLARAVWFGALTFADGELRVRLIAPHTARQRTRYEAGEREIVRLRERLAEDPDERERRIAEVQRRRAGGCLANLGVVAVVFAVADVVCMRRTALGQTVVERLAGVALVRR